MSVNVSKLIEVCTSSEAGKGVLNHMQNRQRSRHEYNVNSVISAVVKDNPNLKRQDVYSVFSALSETGLGKLVLINKKPRFVCDYSMSSAVMAVKNGKEKVYPLSVKKKKLLVLNKESNNESIILKIGNLTIEAPKEEIKTLLKIVSTV